MIARRSENQESFSSFIIFQIIENIACLHVNKNESVWIDIEVTSMGR